MKKFVLILALAIAGISYAQAQTRVVVRPARKVVVVRRPVIRPVVVAPARTVVVRPVVRRRVVVVH